jgi:hypothetical protein
MEKEGEKKKLKISLLAYGSMVQQPHSTHYNARLKLSSEFSLSSISFHCALLRLSSRNTNHARITLVPHQDGVAVPVYAAEVKTSDLDVAIANIRKREGFHVQVCFFVFSFLFFSRHPR